MSASQYFFPGRFFDPAASKMMDEALSYDPVNLTILGEVRQQLAEFQRQLADLQQARNIAIRLVQEKWVQSVSEETDLPVPLKKKNMFLELFGIAWLSYYLVRQEGQLHELASFPAAQK